MSLAYEKLEAEQPRARVAFEMLLRASGVSDWKSAFEVKIEVASSRLGDPPVDFSLIEDQVRRYLSGIEFFHAAAVQVDLESMTAKEVRESSPAYAHFDGYTLTIGTHGYQG